MGGSSENSVAVVEMIQILLAFENYVSSWFSISSASELVFEYSDADYDSE